MTNANSPQDSSSKKKGALYKDDTDHVSSQDDLKEHTNEEAKEEEE